MSKQHRQWVELIDLERARQGMTKSQLAQLTGLTQPKVCNALNGKMPLVSGLTLQKMADALGLELVKGK